MSHYSRPNIHKRVFEKGFAAARANEELRELAHRHHTLGQFVHPHGDTGYHSRVPVSRNVAAEFERRYRKPIQSIEDAWAIADAPHNGKVHDYLTFTNDGQKLHARASGFHANDRTTHTMQPIDWDLFDHAMNNMKGN